MIHVETEEIGGDADMVSADQVLHIVDVCK